MSRDDETEAEQAFRQARKPVNNSHKRGRYIKDADKVLHGPKTTQIGFRLSGPENETIARVVTHWGISFANWVSYSMLRFIEMQQAEPFPNLSTRLTQLRGWTSPSPTPHLRGCLVAESVRERFMRDLTGIPISRAVRWVLLDEAPRALATPSKAERLTAYEAVRVEFNKPRPSRPTVLLPTDQGWMDPSGDDR